MKLEPAFFLAVYALSGVALKTSDFLGERESNYASFLSATLSALFFGLLMSESAFSSSLILGIIVGVVFSRKVDKPNLILGLALTMAFALYFQPAPPDPMLLIAVVLFTFIDEAGHERLGWKKGFYAFFFHYRMVLKLAMTLLTAFSRIKIIQLIGFLLFDLSYDLTNYVVSASDPDQVNK